MEGYEADVLAIARLSARLNVTPAGALDREFGRKLG